MEEKIVIAIASGRGEVPLDFMTAVLDMILKTKEKYPKVSIALITCKQTYIHQARQILADGFLETNGDRLLCIDDDNIPEGDSLIKLLELDLPIASGIYFRRRAPFEPIIMMDRNGGVGTERRPDLWREGENIEPFAVHSTGFGFILIKREVFEKMKTMNVPMFDMRGGVGEDIWFCIQARGAGYDVIIDPRVEIGHLGDRQLVVGKTYRDYYKENIQSRIDKAKLVDGWLSDPEITYLANEAANSDYAIEVGSWKGKSAQVMSLAKKLWCVDKFDGFLEGENKEGSDITGVEFINQFKENTKDYKNITIMQGDSSEKIDQFADDKFDLIFIDGGHDYEQAKKDLENYFKKIKIGSKIVLHDYAEEWGTKKAIDDFMKENMAIATGRLVPETSIYEIIKL